MVREHRGWRRALRRVFSVFAELNFLEDHCCGQTDLLGSSTCVIHDVADYEIDAKSAGAADDRMKVYTQQYFALIFLTDAEIKEWRQKISIIRDQHTVCDVSVE